MLTLSYGNIVNGAARRVSVRKPRKVVPTTDPQISEVAAILNVSVEELNAEIRLQRRLRALTNRFSH